MKIYGIIWLMVMSASFTVMPMKAFSITWRFNNCQGMPGVGSVPCTNIISDSLQGICESQLTIRPDKYKELVRIWVYDPNPISLRAYCFYNTLNGAKNHVTATIDECSPGNVFDHSTMSCIQIKRPQCKVGNPIDVFNGVKTQEEVDYFYRDKWRHEANVRRHYNFRRGFLSSPFYENKSYGGKWRFDYTDRLFFSKYDVGSTVVANTVKYDSPLGEAVYFYSENGTVWDNKNKSEEVLSRYVDTDGKVRWMVSYPGGQRKIFNEIGRLVKILHNEGSPIEISYSPLLSGQELYWNTIEIKQDNVNIYTYKVERKPAAAAYSVSGTENIIRVILPNGESIQYEYDIIGNLVVVLYPNSATKKIYHYENVNYVKALTGITDERGIRYATWTYDAQGRAISSSHADGADNTLLAFNADGSTTVTNPLGKQTTYHFANIAGARRITQVQGHATTSCEGANQNYTYTPEGWLASKTDWKGNITTYSYNSKGQEVSRTEASGTPQAQTIISEWHSTLELKTRIVEGNKETLYTYDTAGRLLTTTINSLPAQQAN